MSIDEEDKRIWLLYAVIGALVVVICVIANVWAMDEPPEPVEMCLYQTSPYLDEEEIKFDELIDRIIHCESNGRIDAQNAHSSANGLGQFITSTKLYVEQKWDMEIDWDTYEGQYYALERLLREEGTSHWNESKHCWQ